MNPSPNLALRLQRQQKLLTTSARFTLRSYTFLTLLHGASVDAVELEADWDVRRASNIAVAYHKSEEEADERAVAQRIHEFFVRIQKATGAKRKGETKAWAQLKTFWMAVVSRMRYSEDLESFTAQSDMNRSFWAAIHRLSAPTCPGTDRRSNTLVVRGPRAGLTHSPARYVVLVLSQPPAPPATDIPTPFLALYIRQTFDFTGHTFIRIIRACVLPYLAVTSASRRARRAARSLAGTTRARAEDGAGGTPAPALERGGDKTIVHDQSNGSVEFIAEVLQVLIGVIIVNKGEHFDGLSWSFIHC